jgi:Coenzyme PQQ synthesis protein D (PqqD)
MSRMSRHPDVVHTELEDGAVLLHLGTRFYYSLNETGRTIWGLLESIDNPAELSTRLLERYQLTADHARISVSRFLSALEKEQLIVAGPDGQAPASPDPGQAAAAPTAERVPSFSEPELIKHDEPLHEVVMNPFDPQLPLAE